MILILHNRYRAAGGEERAVADLASLLARRGHEVEVLERSSQGLGPARAAAGLLAGGLDPGEVGRLVRRRGVRVVHAHNLHPLFGWRALAAAREAGARTLLHLHNFRLFCAIGIAYRDGAPCFRCRRDHTRPGLRLRCRGSLPEATVYALALRRQQPPLFEHVDQFVAVSGALAAHCATWGSRRSSTATLPNFMPDDELAAQSAAGDGEFALAAGPPVRGEGVRHRDRRRERRRRSARDRRAPGPTKPDCATRPLGPTSASPAGSRPAISPTCAGVPRSCSRPRAGRSPARTRCSRRWRPGVPVLASDRGGLPELVGDEATLPASDPAAWTKALFELWHDPALRAERGADGLARVREQFGEKGYYDRLMRLYDGVSP